MTLEIKKSSCRSSIVWSNRDGALNDFHLDYCTKPTLPMLQAITNTSSKTMWQRSDTQLLLGVRCRLAGTWGVTSVHVSTMGNQVARPCSHKNGRCLQWSLWKMSSKIALLLNCPTTVQPGWPVWRSHFRAQSRSSCYFSVSMRSEAIEPCIWMGLISGKQGAFTLQEIGECFDSAQLCLTKGLGAPIGSVVVGDFIFTNRWWKATTANRNEYCLAGLLRHLAGRAINSILRCANSTWLRWSIHWWIGCHVFHNQITERKTLSSVQGRPQRWLELNNVFSSQIKLSS